MYDFRPIDEDILLKDSKEQINYYIKEHKVIKYAKDFFNELCSISCSKTIIRSDILPITCYNEISEILWATAENNIKKFATGDFIYSGHKQAMIRIGIKSSNNRLTANLKQTIRHEIIHYYLWLNDLPHKDNSLEFWCLCYVFDGKAYSPLSESDNKKYKTFVDLYNNKCKNPYKAINDAAVGYLISAISKDNGDKISKTLDNLITQIEDLYSKL